MSAIGRAAYAEERRILRDALLSRYQLAERADGRKGIGLERRGLRAALEVLGVSPDRAHEGATAYDEAVGSVSTGTDIVDVGIFPLDGDEHDTLPVRLAVTDGAGDDATSFAYLSLDDAIAVVELLTEAIASVERRWAEAEAEAVAS